jgi:hypothetical protein
MHYESDRFDSILGWSLTEEENQQKLILIFMGIAMLFVSSLIGSYLKE